MVEDLEKQEEELVLQNELQTHKNIQANHSYKLLELYAGYAKISINSEKSESVDNNGTVYDGSIFSAANFCAMAAVNEKNTFLISAKVDFLNPIKNNDSEVIFEATATTNISGKKNISVIAKVNDIITFSGDFVSIKLNNQSLIKATK